MIFNSLQFLFFYVIITLLYWQLPWRGRWLMLLLASCYFYMAFVPKYILILGFTIVIDYIAGICLEHIKIRRLKLLFLIGSLLANIGVLVIFKYYNFFAASLTSLTSLSEHPILLSHLSILLPIGLSFHTFQAMSYTIEVYRGNQKAEKHFGIYALYVMFYPQLVAGPIERPQNVLWQFHVDHRFDKETFKEGLMQMAFGFFKKMVIADRLGELVDHVYAFPQDHSPKTVLIACIFYSFQIYCDFSGYSDIALGSAKTMGFKLMLNFNMPYLSKSISEFWGRWHISLSSWFRDYLYIPLGGNRVSAKRWSVNIMIVFLVSGLWHGANWTFILWGALHGFYFLFARFKDYVLEKWAIGLPSRRLTKIVQIGITFSLVTFAWIFFRAQTIGTAIAIIQKIGAISFFDSITYVTSKTEIIFSFLLILFLLVKEKFWPILPTKRNSVFFLILIALVLSCYFFGVVTNHQFIYFQF